MEPDIRALVQRIDELSGALAAALAVLAAMPSIDQTVIQKARELLDKPNPLEIFSARPQDTAKHALDRLQELVERLAQDRLADKG